MCCFSTTEDTPFDMKLVFDPTFWSNHKHLFDRQSEFLSHSNMLFAVIYRIILQILLRTQECPSHHLP